MTAHPAISTCLAEFLKALVDLIPIAPCNFQEIINEGEGKNDYAKERGFARLLSNQVIKSMSDA